MEEMRARDIGSPAFESVLPGDARVVKLHEVGDRYRAVTALDTFRELAHPSESGTKHSIHLTHQTILGQQAGEVAPTRRVWVPEEAFPESPRLNGGAASPPPPPNIKEVLLPLLPNPEGKVFSSLSKARGLLKEQKVLLETTAREVRAQYDRIRIQELQKLRLQELPRALFNKQAKEVIRFGEQWKHVDLTASHELTQRTRLDTSLSGSPLRFDQLSLKLHHSGCNDLRGLKKAKGQHLSLTGATDLRSRTRIAVEGKLSNDEDTHSCSTIFASDNLSYLSWGIASQHRLSKRLTVFARASGDDFQGRKVMLQTVHTLNLRDSISPVVAIVVGRAVQAGVGWTRQLSHDPTRVDDKISLKVLASGKGAYAVNFAFKGTGA